jgi:YesN/AraC family two-component response regulator
MILVVDDEPLIRFGIGRILKRHGYEVIEAADGPEALELLLKWRFDLVITDVRMPNVDGADLALQIHANWPETGVILSSGYFSDKAQKIISAGLAGFIYKPIEADLLIAKVQRAALSLSVQKIHPASPPRSQDNTVATPFPASQNRTCSRNFKTLKT